MQPLFDIAGDLDTPVSAFLKLAAFAPRFLLESVEGGERLARYSFIGFGDGLEVRLDASGLSVGRPAPAGAGQRRGAARRACAPRSPRRPGPSRTSPGVPLAGGLVGYAAYDVVRYFERLPRGRDAPAGCPRCTTWRRARCWCSIT